MNRTEARTVVLALLAVVVAGVAAATISTSVPGSGFDAGDAGQSGSESEQLTEEDDERVLPEIGFEFDYTLDAHRQDGGEDDDGGGDESDGGDGDAALNPQSPTGVAALVGAVLLVGLALLVRSRSGDDDREDEADTDEETVERVRQVAGEAADRIETDAHADPDNEVYRAWRELTTHLDVADPRTSTPAEFAAAAVEAGVDREAVSELTAVFRAVRYGGRTPTDERERRAVEALRRIEGGDDADDENSPEEGSP